MREVKLFPVRAGELGWYHDSNCKNHVFNSVADIQDSYDFVVIGAGFAGVNACHRLAEHRPDASIALFDALEVGMGDSGRNAGFLIDVPHSFGEAGISADDHKMRTHLNNIVINYMRDIKNANNLDIDWDETGKYLAAREEKFVKNLQGMAGVLDLIKEPYEMIEGKDLPEKMGTNYYCKALYTPGTVLLNPSEVIRGLATALPKNVHVFECTPVMQIYEGPVNSVQLLNGKNVKANNIFILASVFGEEFGASRGKMTPVNSFGAFTRVLSEQEMSQFKDIKPWGCTSGHAAGTTVRFTKTNRIFVRNGFSFASSLCTSPQRIQWSKRDLRKSFEARFPSLKHVNFEHVYGGMIPMTFNNESLFSKLSNGIYAGSVGDGAGLTRSSMLGYYMADWACGVHSEELSYIQKNSKPNWCPPDPFKTIGATVRLKIEEIMAMGEK